MINKQSYHITIKKALYLIIFSSYLFLLNSCFKGTDPPLHHVMLLAGENRPELQKVLHHYSASGNEQKLKAAEFLISNMQFKFSYEGDILHHYDTIFYLYDSLRKNGVIVGDPPVVTQTWNFVEEKYGAISSSRLKPKFDCANVTADFLIQNIDQAFFSWEKSPFYNPDQFNTFCEYVLPYRIQNEPFEVYRQKYYDSLHHIVDTAKTVRDVVKGFHLEMRWNRNFRPSGLLHNYPVEFPISLMEVGRRGACRHLTTYTTLYMRSCGLPVTIDRAVWANRSQGHSWNVLIINDSTFFPFDALASDSITLAYTPAKIFRKNYSCNLDLYRQLNSNDVPSYLFALDEIDVTNEYRKTFDIKVPIEYSSQKYKKKKHGLICVFDNMEWRPVYWGSIHKGKLFFQNMPPNIAYIGAFYDKGKIVPATPPFVLDNEGIVRELIANKDSLLTLNLERKYPRFKRIEDHAWGMRRTNAEGANNLQFQNSKRFFSIYEPPFEVTDSFINDRKKYRYVRLRSADHRNANFAEVEFYGKKQIDDVEVKLTGKLIGYPPVEADDEHPYTHAMDGNLESYFSKEKGQEGWVGLDLGEGNEHVITRIRFCPRSDTNFILKDDEYELLYWDNNGWNSVEKKVAPQYNTIKFENVPSGTMYLLRNHTRGKEERIFTYVNDKQIWW